MMQSILYVITLSFAVRLIRYPRMGYGITDLLVAFALAFNLLHTTNTGLAVLIALWLCVISVALPMLVRYTQAAMRRRVMDIITSMPDPDPVQDQQSREREYAKFILGVLSTAFNRRQLLSAVVKRNESSYIVSLTPQFQLPEDFWPLPDLRFDLVGDHVLLTAADTVKVVVHDSARRLVCIEYTTAM